MEPSSPPAREAEHRRDGDAEGEAHDEGAKARHEKVRSPCDEAHAERRDRRELRTQDHRADDEDLGIEDDGDRCDQGGHGHERQEAPTELSLLITALHDLRPDDRVRLDAGGGLRRLESALRDPGLDGCDLDASVLTDAQAVQHAHDASRTFARDRGLDEIARRIQRCSADARECADGGIAAQGVDCLGHGIRGAVGTKVQHGSIVPREPRGGAGSQTFTT